MASNWPPATFPEWPPEEAEAEAMFFATIQDGIAVLQGLGFTRANPTAAENNLYFKQVRCDHNDPCQGIMIVSPSGIRYPFAYCTGANHKSALVLWDVSNGTEPNPCYDLGWNSGAIA